MAKKATEPTVSIFEPDDEQKALMANIALKIKGKGFVPHAELRDEFGERPFTIFSAIGYRDWRMVREVRRSIGPNEAVLGYEWADRRFSQTEAKKVPPQAQWILDPLLTGKGGARYADYRQMTVVCRWTNHVLASLPVADSDKKRVFERSNGHILIPGYCQRAMLRKVLPLIGKTITLGDNIRASAIRIPVPENGALKLMPVVDEKARQGLGVTEYESLPPGTQFSMELWYPSSEITHEQLVEALALAGRVVRLSPARSAGYGDFELVSVNGESI
jgi:hypothetical protein